MTLVRVIGAGLSGLSAAWFLTKAGAKVEVVEASNRAGGLIGTRARPQGIVERAANAFLWTPAVRDVFSELGVEPVFPKPSSRRRYIFRDGAPRRWPLTAGETVRMAARFGRSAIARSTVPRDRESAADWGRRVFGPAATTHLLEPALQGIYASPAASLSAAAIGLGQRKARPRLAAPRGGMGELIDALRRALERAGATLIFEAPALRIEPGTRTIIATNSRDAARLVKSAGLSRLTQAIERIEIAPLVTATAFYEPSPDDLHGFGVLFPPGTARARGVLFNSDIFEGRSACRSETWIFGDRDLLDASDTDVAAAIQQDRPLIGARGGGPMAVEVTRVPSAIPVYGDAVVDVANALDELPPWLGLCGNYLGRIGVAALIERARREAERLVAPHA